MLGVFNSFFHTLIGYILLLVLLRTSLYSADLNYIVISIDTIRAFFLVFQLTLNFVHALLAV